MGVSWLLLLGACPAAVLARSADVLGPVPAAVPAVSAPALPSGWSQVQGAAGEVRKTDAVTLGFVLKTSHTEPLREVLAKVSDPRSKSYGLYLSYEDAQVLSSPEVEDQKVLEDWLKSEGVEPESVGAGLVEAQIYVEQASKLLGTSFSYVTDGTTQVLRAGDVSIPKSVMKVLDGITGLYGLPIPSGPKLGAAGQVKVTPEVLRSTYSITGASSPSATQAIVSFLTQTMNTTDLESFFAQYVTGPQASAPGADQVSKFVGDGAVGKGENEASLDIEYIMGVAPAAPTEFWYFSGTDFCALMKRWTAKLVAARHPPLVHSVSYGWQGDLEGAGCNMNLINSIETDLVVLASRGLTIVFSSGDDGSGWSAPSCTDEGLRRTNTVVQGTPERSFRAYSVPQCCGTANSAGFEAWSFDGHTCHMYKQISGTAQGAGVTSGGDLVVKRRQELRPAWPASSPVVTSVGATKFTEGEGSEEMATTSFGSGGGFSPLFEAPWYQQHVTGEYLGKLSAQNLPPAESFPPNGRATPDVSLLGEGYQVIVNGELMVADGTSASAPSFAAMVSLLNAARLRRGMPPMGFLNPFLYQNPDVFKDVTKGNNKIGRWGPLKFGWECAEGWDPVTGLGTPNYERLEEAALRVGAGHEGQQVLERHGQLHRHSSSGQDRATAGERHAQPRVEEVEVGSFLQEPQAPIEEL